MSSSNPPLSHEAYALDRRAVRRSFDLASKTYDRAAALQTEVRDRLLERLDFVRISPAIVLDLGAGTGHASKALRRRYHRKPRSSRWMWRRECCGKPASKAPCCADSTRICASAFRLPLQDASVDLIYSNLMLQWCDEPDAVFAEVRRVLKPHGLFTFTSFGPDTLQELRRAWAAADPYTHVNHFIDMHDLGDALVRARLAEPIMDVERYTLTYPQVRGLLKDLKAIGAHNVTAGRPRGLMGRKTLARMQAAYESLRQEGLLPASYEVVFGQAWRAEDSGIRRSSPAEVHISPSAIGRRPSKT